MLNTISMKVNFILLLIINFNKLIKEIYLVLFHIYIIDVWLIKDIRLYKK